MDVLAQTSSVFTCIMNKFSLLIRLKYFPLLATSKGVFYTRDIHINNTRWYISTAFLKFCQTSGEYIRIMPDSFYQPETLGFFIHGSRHHAVEKDCSFDVEAQIKFNQVQTARGYNFTRKFCLNSSNNYTCGCGTPRLAKIEVAFTFAFFIKFNLRLGSLEPTKQIFGWQCPRITRWCHNLRERNGTNY